MAAIKLTASHSWVNYLANINRPICIKSCLYNRFAKLSFHGFTTEKYSTTQLAIHRLSNN